MIVLNTDELAKINCGCCLPAECGGPRVVCQSVTVSTQSIGFFDPTNTEWLVYRKRLTNVTASLSGPLPDYSTEYEHVSFSGSGTDIYDDQHTRVFAGGVFGLCQQWHSPFSRICTSSGSSVLTVTHTPGPPYSGPGWVDTTTRTAVQPVAGDCSGAYHEIVNASTHPDAGDPTTSYEQPGFANVTAFGLFHQNTVETETYSEGYSFLDWCVYVLATIDDDLDFELSIPICNTGFCSPSIKLPHEPINIHGDSYGVEITKSRYRIGVPYTAEDMPRSVFEAQWDLYSFPHGWIEWEESVTAYAAAIIAHADWVVAQEFYDANIGAYDTAIAEWYVLSNAWMFYGMYHEYWLLYPQYFPEGEPQPPAVELGPAPPRPTDPGTEPEAPLDPGAWVNSPLNACGNSDGPMLISSESWVWGGDMGAFNEDPNIFDKNPEQWSDWFTMPPPALPSPMSSAWNEYGNFRNDCVNRDIRITNMMTKCYRASSVGVAPTIHPPIYSP